MSSQLHLIKELALRQLDLTCPRIRKGRRGSGGAEHTGKQERAGYLDWEEVEDGLKTNFDFWTILQGGIGEHALPQILQESH